MMKTKKHVHVIANRLEEYQEGIENLRNAGFELKDQTFGWDLWETEKTRYFVQKDF